MPLGVIYAFIAYAVYSTSDAFVKGIGGTVSIFEIGFFIYLFSLIPALFAKPKGERWRDIFHMRHPWLVNLRAFVGVVSAVLVTYSFTTIPLAETYAIVFLIPVFITILSVLVLKEHVSRLRWALVIVSFVGVMIVVRPGFREIEAGHITAFICAGFSAVTTTVLRIISGKEKRTSLIAIPAIYALVFNCTMMVIFGFKMPPLYELGILVLTGILVGTGHLMLIAATKNAQASQVAPIQYSQIVWGIGFGAIFYHEFPDAIAMVGIAVVVGAGLINVFSDGPRARIAGRFSEFRARRSGQKFETPDHTGPEV